MLFAEKIGEGNISKLFKNTGVQPFAIFVLVLGVQKTVSDLSLYFYVYIYIYIYVSVCVYVCVYSTSFLILQLFIFV